MNTAQLLRTALPLGLVLAVGSIPAAQAGRKVDSDMQFARGLAARFGYVDLAEEVISSLESKNLTGSDAEALGLVKCDVYASGARGARKIDERFELYAKAIDAYKSYLDANPYSDYIDTAQKNYVNLVKAYGSNLERQLEDLLGDEASAMRKQIKDLIDGGLDLTSDLIDLTTGADTRLEKNERWRLMINRGQMLLTLANVSEDGTYIYSRAEKVLEDLALEASETSGPGLNAFLLLARVKMAQDLPVDASDFAGFVYDVVLPIDDEEKKAVDWDELSLEAKLPRWKLGELAASIVIDAYQAQGRADKASRYSLAFYNTWKEYGFDISPLGHLSLLSAARALLQSGGYVGGAITSGQLRWFATEEEMSAAGFSGTRQSRSALDLALSIAQGVNSANKGNTLQKRAQKVISTIIGRPGVRVSPDILIEAAEGEYLDNEWDRSIQACKGILRQLDARDEATQREHAPKVLFILGKSLNRLGRNLEAAMAYREAATVWKGDPELDEKVATGYYSAIGKVRKAAANAPQFEELFLQAETLLREVGTGDNNTIAFRQAERAYGTKDFSAARALYQQLEEGGSLYEKSLSKAALCLYKVADIEGARAEFTHYLEQHVKDPRNKTVDARKTLERSEAMAVAKFYMGRMAYSESDWTETINWLGAYAREFPDQSDYGPNALFMVVRAFIAQSKFEDAKRVIAEMTEAFGSHSRTGAAAFQMYQALTIEHDAQAADGNEAGATALKAEMANYMRLSNQLKSTPSQANLRKESVLWIELERWEDAELVLRQIVKAFGSDSSVDLTSYVLPDLGLALLEQNRVPDAYQVLDPLVAKTDDDKRKPRGTVIARWCRSVTGWVTGDGNSNVEVPGVGGAADLKLAAEYLDKLTKSEGAKSEPSGKYSCPWYHFKFDTVYAYVQWGKEDSERTRTAFVLIENLQNILASTQLSDIATKCGDDVLRKRFLWLLAKVK